MSQLSEGLHSLKIIAFDNFNQPAVKQIDFKVSKSENLELNNVLVYPNPLKDNGYFTFMADSGSDGFHSGIYSDRQKNQRYFSRLLFKKGYNQIYWDAKDNDGDRIANNTYFYKIKAKPLLADQNR